MAEYSYLKSGFRWARPKTGSNFQERGRWVVLKFSGQSPFLEVKLAFDPSGFFNDENLPDLRNPITWEYGRELEIPSNAILENVPGGVIHRNE